MIEYKQNDIDYNVKAAVNNLREAYWFDGECDAIKKQLFDAEDIIIRAICHQKYTLIKEENENGGEE